MGKATGMISIDFLVLLRTSLAIEMPPFFTRFPLPRLQPAALSAVFLVTLAIFVLVANHRRPINRIWALLLLFLALWQGGIAMTYWYSDHIFLRLAVLFGACGICTCGLLIETIASPWRSLPSRLRRISLQLALLPLYFLSFSRWWLIPSVLPLSTYERGPIFWLLDIVGFLWMISLLTHSVYLIRQKKVPGIARSELLALVVLIISGSVTYIVTFVFGGLLNISHASWRAPSIFVAGLSIVTVLLVRNEIFDLRDFRKGFVLLSARGLIYIATGFLCIAFLSGLGQITVFFRFALGIVLIFALMTLPIFDRKLHHLVDRQFISQDFLHAQEAINALIEKTQQPSNLHTQFVEVLRRWSDGSPNVFLSDAFFIAAWPSEPIPPDLLHHLVERKWSTPEILDRQGSQQQELGYLLLHQIGAIVCVTAESGEKLVAAFETRRSQRPFVSRELREAHELLRLIQLGLSFAKVSRKLLGSERLNFYAQYAPQFAHELRNGLYLQNQLLRAIAEGRTADVLPSDARIGLERIEQVDRLCEHFLNVRALYDRPICEVDFKAAVMKTIDGATSQFVKEAHVAFRTSILTPPNLCALANPELFSMAVHNLLKNAVEALEDVDRPKTIEVSATLHLETVHLLIHDNGPGLSNSRLQDPFTPSLSYKRSGMGLGLAIARDCIEAMGGTIGVRLSDSDGTCFEITLNCVPSRGNPDIFNEAPPMPNGSGNIGIPNSTYKFIL